jgi:DNA-binding MarR family transcriptional regulator
MAVRFARQHVAAGPVSCVWIGIGVKGERKFSGISREELLEAHRVLGRLVDQLEPGSRAREQDRSRAAFAERVYKLRRLRSKYFPEGLFADPAWDILLLLYSLEQGGKRISISAVCASAGVPVTTGHRWIERLIEAGLVERERHPSDRRMVWLRLSPATVERLDAYLDDMIDSYFRNIAT